MVPGRIVQADKPRAVEQAASALSRGELVVLPTDTVYGIAARVDRRSAIAALIDAKGRSSDLALPVLVADLDQARAVGRFSSAAERLAEKFWPGPLTVVVERVEGFDVALGGDGETVGVRVPDHEVALDLLRSSGPLATSSANRSGEETPKSVDKIAEIFGGEVAIYLDGGLTKTAMPSAVVSLAGGEVRILREGALSETEIREVLGA